MPAAGRIRRKRPSGAMLVAIGAAVLAIVGTAVADPLASSSKLDKKEKKQVRSIATGVVNSLAAGLSVANAQTAGSAQSAQSATNATNAGTLDGQDSSAFVPAGAVIRVPTQQMMDEGAVTAADLPNVDVDLECQIDIAGQDVVSASISFASVGSVVFGGNTEVGFAGDAFPIFNLPHPATGTNRMNQSAVSIVSDEGTSLTGTIWAAFNLDGTTDRCFVGGHLVATG